MSDKSLLRPLRSPLGIRQIFFFRKIASEIYPYRNRRRGWILPLVVGAMVFFGMELMFREGNRSRRGGRPWNEGEILILLNLMWPIAEGLLFVFGSFAAAPATRWKKTHRMEELSLTALRPLEIGQIVLAPGIRTLDLMLALMVGAFMLSIAHWQSEHLWLIFPISIIAFNAALTARMSGWAQMTFSLSWGKNKSFFAFAYLFIVFAINAIPFGFVFGISQAAIYDKTSDPYAFLNALIPMSLAFAALKYFYAAGYAAHLETAIMPNMEHS